MPEADLEGVMKQKEFMYDGLNEKNKLLRVLNDETKLSVSFTLNLNYREQLYYSNLGAYHNYMDINKRSKAYKIQDDNL